MKITRIAGVAALLAAGFAQAQAQDVKVNALIELWYTQMLDSNLRNDTVNPVAKTYYGLDSRFQENTINVKRAEIYLSGKVADGVTWNILFDPSLALLSQKDPSNTANTNTLNGMLHDAMINWDLGNGFMLRAGQTKLPTVYESTILSAREILFMERSQLAKVFGERRDRGIWGVYSFGDPNGLSGKFNVVVSNGTSDDGTGGKSNDADAQKDWTTRLEFALGKTQKFGVYYREGETGLKNSKIVAANTAAWGVAGVPSAQDILDNRDKTTLLGGYYAFDDGTWHGDVEVVSGLLGRRFPTLYATTAAAAAREYLDQKYLGYALTGSYKMGRHVFAARYDVMNYNSGDNWYTATSPYVTANGDFSPKYAETILGYNLLFDAAKPNNGKVKFDYVIRKKNFLDPNASAGQSGPQGGNSFVISMMIGF